MIPGPSVLGPAAEPRCGLYVHTPFCETKCGYCDFFSVSLKGRETGPLVRRVIRELRSRVENCPLPIRTIFVGGGTPTLLPFEQLDALLRSVGELVSMDGVGEFTVEANPATVEDDKARLLTDRGVTRVSMGAQSFFPSELATLERLHSPEDVAPSVATLRRNGVGQLNLDLIFGIPGQTVKSWAESLRRAIELGPDHISCYGLTYEPATRLTALRDHGKITPCDENLEADMYLGALDTLAEHGYEQYETSNFARPGCRCEHNLIYWRNGPYIGVGPSAAGCYEAACQPPPFPRGDDRGVHRLADGIPERVHGRRYKNIADIGGYIRMIDELGHAEKESEWITTEMLMMEMVMMQLRTAEGLSIADFRRRTGVDPLLLFAEPLSQFVDRRLLVVSEMHIALTRQGRLVSDVVIERLAALPGIGAGIAAAALAL